MLLCLEINGAAQFRHVCQDRHSRRCHCIILLLVFTVGSLYCKFTNVFNLQEYLTMQK